MRTDGDELAKMLECTELHAYAPSCAPPRCAAAPTRATAAPLRHRAPPLPARAPRAYAPRLDAVATCLVAQLEKAALPEAVAKKCAEWLVSEVRARAAARRHRARALPSLSLTLAPHTHSSTSSSRGGCSRWSSRSSRA